jgi:apolipoprotein N-acyltransferase
MAGGAFALSLPPLAIWPLGPLGIALLARALAGRPGRQRLALGAVAGLVHFGAGLWWALAFSGPGYILLVVLEASFFAIAALATPGDRIGGLGLTGALVLAEAARARWPFGGLPLAGLALGQVGGPLFRLAPAAGPLGVMFLVAMTGVGVAGVTSQRGRKTGVTVLIAAAALIGLAPLLATGETVGSVNVAAVQGGGPRGVRAVNADTAAVLVRHLAATEEVRRPVDLVLWPEGVVDLSGPLNESPTDQELAGLAQRLQATLVVGVVEDVSDARFRNAAVAYGPAGDAMDRYEKVHRVPFGEYVPARELIGRIADLSDVPRDAIPGRGPGLLRTPAGRLGAMISYEVFFPERARASVQAGAEILLVPTNASSYRTRQVPAQELAAAQLRARETGRALVQAAPTGYSAMVAPSGRVLTRGPLGRPAVVQRPLELRRGLTLYARTGDPPVLALAAAALAYSWARGSRGRRDTDVRAPSPVRLLGSS